MCYQGCYSQKDSYISSLEFYTAIFYGPESDITLKIK